jgi:hypothetical protein
MTLDKEKLTAWLEPVNGEVLYTVLKDTFLKYVVLPERTEIPIALWTLLTYAYMEFETAPRLAIISPEKRCGKSTLMDLLATLAYNTKYAENITPAVLFRTIKKYKPTLLIDEADTFLKKSDDLRGILNAGYKHNGTVMRCEPITHEPKEFPCFAPCAIAGIGNLPTTIMDRSIVITMRRKVSNEKTERLRARLVEKEVYELRQKCLRFMQDNAIKAGEIIPEIVPELNDRAMDTWEPLLAIAGIISPAVEAEARAAAVFLANQRPDEEDIRTMLLRDIKSLFDDEVEEVCKPKGYVPKDIIYSSVRLCERLREIKTSPWGTWSGKGFIPHSLAGLLKGFGIRSQQMSVGDRTRGYFRSDFEDAFKRYLPNSERTNDCSQ